MIKKLTESLLKIISYIKYLLTARHRKGHGIHSPFVFELVANVIYDRSVYDEYILFTCLRNKLKTCPDEVKVEDFGASSKSFKQNNRKIADLVRISSVNDKYGRLLFRLVKSYQPKNIIELGTSIGLGTAYLAKGCSHSNIYTIEGNRELCHYSEKFFKENNLGNIEIREGKFDDLLPGILDHLSGTTLIFIDGNHRYQPTINYFLQICASKEECIIIFDDINWSADMRKAWLEILKDRRSTVTIDLFYMGIVIRRKNITPGRYTVWF